MPNRFRPTFASALFRRRLTKVLQENGGLRSAGSLIVSDGIANPSPDRIDLADPDQVLHWCQVFGCEEEGLRKAITVVGDRVDRVRTYLAWRPS